MSLVFRQLHDPRSSTYTYLLADPESGEAVLIDPVFEQARRDSALVRELGLHLVWTLDTHVHADHITGAWLLKQLTGSRIAISGDAGASEMDRVLSDGDRVQFGSRHLEARATPGHTPGCMTYVLDDRSMAFTGDALLIRSAGRTDFQNGDPHTLYRSITEKIFALPEACLIYPAHDYRGLTCSSVGEEKRYNPRIGDQRSEGDFVGFMENLGLPHPKQLEVALPANLSCGHVEAAENAQRATWAPLRYTYAGIDEVDPDWVAEHMRDLQIVDVREPQEYTGELGHIRDATLVPLGQLPEETGRLDRGRPTVAVCRSGGRSARAVAILEKDGFERVANLTGGMLAWNERGLPVRREGDDAS